jgi:steroid delta-isomerase-like uncharacterized protein
MHAQVTAHLVHQFVGAVNTHDRAALEQIVAIPSLLDLHDTYWTAFPDFRMEVEETIIHDNTLVLRWRAHGTHLGPLLQMPPSYRPITISGIGIYRVRDGKIVEHWISTNYVELMQQLSSRVPRNVASAV